MAKKRLQPKEKDKHWLYSEINGRCPRCDIKLLYEDSGVTGTIAEAAHIYPLNPSDDEKEILKGVELLTDDVNHRNNFIYLCGNCHKKFDHPRTKKKYEELLKLKKELITKDKYRELHKKYTLEEEIISVIHELSNIDMDLTGEKSLYKAVKIKNKVKGKLKPLKIRRIEEGVSQYFNFIKTEFEKLEEDDFDVIASQIKALFRKLYKENDENYLLIIESIKDWIYKETGFLDIDACELLVYYFIQNCEVFDEISK